MDERALVADLDKLRRLALEFESRKLQVNDGKSKVLRCLWNVDAFLISICSNEELLEEVQ